VACRPQSNPRRTVPDGVPPGSVNLGFRRRPYLRQSDCVLQVVRPARAGDFDELISDLRVIQHSRVFNQKKRQQLSFNKIAHQKTKSRFF
jgi:hypothetical protein